MGPGAVAKKHHLLTHFYLRLLTNVSRKVEAFCGLWWDLSHFGFVDSTELAVRAGQGGQGLD